MINTTINKAAADLSKTASIFYDRAIFLADTVDVGLWGMSMTRCLDTKDRESVSVHWVLGLSYERYMPLE